MYRDQIIKNSLGEKLSGRLFCGNNDLIIVCHGRCCTQGEYFIPRLCITINKAGYSCFSFDFAGNGESEGLFTDCTISKEVEDIRSIVEHFKEKGYNIQCIVGHSMGGVTSLIYQAKYHGSQSVINIAGLLDQAPETVDQYSDEERKAMNKVGYIEKEVFGKTFRISQSYYEDRCSYGDISEDISRITCPIFVIQGLDDEPHQIKDGRKMITKLNPESKLLEIPKANHFFDEHQNELEHSVLIWLSIGGLSTSS